MESAYSMTSRKAYDTPTNVTVVRGEVVLDGPDGVGLSMTAEAAAETGRRLSEAAERAIKQKERRRTARAKSGDTSTSD